MHIDPSEHPVADNYKLLTNLVVPRPIAWVTTCNTEGVVNLAPFSFFNAIGSDPLYIFISVARNSDGSQKDTARNIEANGQFVVNLVTEDVLAAMNVSAADFPPDLSEAQATGLDTVPSRTITVPRLAAVKASLECKLHSQQELGAYTLIIGEVTMFHVADELMGERLHVNGFNPVGRMGSPAFYCRTTDRFELLRTTYAKWKQGQD